MVVRRLMSGWLFALAALARAMAAALERAATERSEPAIGPVMAELRERYPDAPDHWLAFIAERMSAEARGVEAAAPGMAEPAAWPSTDPREPSLAPAVEASAPAAQASVVSAGSPARRREAAAVPTMAELASRSTETWRPPDAGPRRPSRPVFARPVFARPAFARPAFTLPAFAPSVDPPPRAVSTTSSPSGMPTTRRPRSPLALAAHRPPPATPVPMDVELAAEHTPLEEFVASQNERPRGGRRAGVIASSQEDGLKAAPPSWHETPGGDHRGDGPRPAAPVLASRFGGANPPPASPWISETSAAPGRKPSAAAAWRERPDRTSTDTARADTRPVQPLRSITVAPAVGSATATPRPSAPAGRSFVRRLIDKATAVTGARRRRSRSDVAAEEPALKSPSPSSPSVIDRRASHPFAGPDLASANDAKGGEERGLAPRSSSGPRRQRLADIAWPPARQDDRAAASPARTSSSPRPHRHREFAFSTRHPAPRETTDRDPAAAVDGRWPALPPATFAPTPTAETAAPRWSRLAREQEEGLWNA